MARFESGLKMIMNPTKRLNESLHSGATGAPGIALTNSHALNTKDSMG